MLESFVEVAAARVSFSSMSAGEQADIYEGVVGEVGVGAEVHEDDVDVEEVEMGVLAN